MTPSLRKALARVVKARHLYQRDVAAGDRDAFLQLMSMGMIEEDLGDWSLHPYWKVTAKGQKESL